MNNKLRFLIWAVLYGLGWFLSWWITHMAIEPWILAGQIMSIVIIIFGMIIALIWSIDDLMTKL